MPIYYKYPINLEYKNISSKLWVLFLFILFMLGGCSGTLEKSDKYSLISPISIEETRSEVLKYLIINSARIDENNDNYIQAFFPSDIEAQYGDHGFIVGIWFQEEERGVRLFIDTASKGHIRKSEYQETIISDIKARLFNN